MAGILDALRAFFDPPPGFEPYTPLDRVVFMGRDERSLSYEQMWRTGADTAPTNTAAGVTVDAESAMRSIVFQSGVRLLVNDVGSLPVDAFRSVDGNQKKELTRPSFVASPVPNNPNVTWEDHVKQTVYGILTDGNAFTRCFPSVFDPQAIVALPPEQVEIESAGLADGVLYHVKGESQALTPNEIIHVPWFLAPGKHRGVNPIEAGREGLGIALAADQFVGSYFGNGAVLSGWIGFPPGVEPTETQIKDMVKGFSQKHVGVRKSHAVGALTAGAEYHPFDYNNKDAQLLELRDQIVEEVARLLGIPPVMLGSQKPGAVGYNSVEQRAIDYVIHGILPIVKRIEVGYSRLLRGQRTYLRFNLDGLKRGDQTARAAFYDSMLQNKVLRRDEVRRLEDFEFDPDAVGYLETPNNNAPDETPAQEPAA